MNDVKVSLTKSPRANIAGRIVQDLHLPGWTVFQLLS